MRNFARWPRWQQVIFVNLIVVLLILGFLLFPQSYAVPELATAGDPYDAVILRDTWGVPHIFGKTDADVAYGLAYAHAEDDFLTIQQALAAAKGQLAEIYGTGSAPPDYLVQLLKLEELIDAKYETDIDAETRAVLEAYAAGLNHYAALHGREIIGPLFPMTGKDVALGFMQKTPFFFGLDGTLREIYSELRQRPVSRAAETAGPPRQALSDFYYYGSNTISVAPSRTENEETFLLVNSHQPWTGPVAWYEAHVHSEEGWDAAGGLFPGAPMILMGHNQHLGWSMTTNRPDLIDVFVLDINPENENQYRFDGEWRDLEVSESNFRVRIFGRLIWTVREEILWSVYGPTIRRPHGTYAIRYAGYGEVDLAEQWFHMNKATTFDEWYTAMADNALPSFNVGYADNAGNIFYVYNARLPIRSERYDWEQYLPGDTSETLWDAFLPFEDLPQVHNPPIGFTQNANSNPFQTTLGAGNPDETAYSPTFGIETYMTNRALRALELFGEDESITFEEFMAYKFDLAYSQDSDAARIKEIIVNMPEPLDPAEAEAQQMLATWDLSADPNSEAASIALLTIYYLSQIEELELEASRLVDSPFTEEQVIQSFADAVAHLESNFDWIDVPWQEVNRLQRGDNVDIGLGGGPDLLHAIYGAFGDDGRLGGTAGDSYVMLVQWDAEGQVSSQSVHQFGSNTLDRSSPHYADQAPLFAERQLKPVWLDEEDIRANLSREYRPGE